MSPVLDKQVKLSSPGEVSAWHSGNVKWAGYAVEAVAVAQMSEAGYQAIAIELPWTWVQVETGGFAAVDNQTGIYGVGADRNEAVRDLLMSLAEHLDVLERQEALSPGLEEQMSYLRSFL